VKFTESIKKSNKVDTSNRNSLDIINIIWKRSEGL